MMNDTLDVTIFVPCYNESKNIVSALEVINKTLNKLHLNYEIVIMDDCSSDDSYAVASKYIAEHSQYRISIHRQERNMGLAYNFSDAAFIGKGKYFRQVNGDADESEENLVKLFKHLGSVDIIIPYHEDAKVRGKTRRFISSIYTIIVNKITGFRLKYYNGMAVYKRIDVMRWHSHSHGFGYQAELLASLLYSGASYVEVPLIAVQRKSGNSKAFSFMNILSVMHTMLKLMLKRISNNYHKNRLSFAKLVDHKIE